MLFTLKFFFPSQETFEYATSVITPYAHLRKESKKVSCLNKSWLPDRINDRTEWGWLHKAGVSVANIGK